MNNFYPNLDPYDQMLKIPDEVIRAARTVRNWVDSNMVGMHDVNIYGVGVRTFLSVKEMLDASLPDTRISELIETDK